MIRIDIVGAGGWLSVLLLTCLVVALPWWGYVMGKIVAGDAADQERHEEFMRAHAVPTREAE